MLSSPNSTLIFKVANLKESELKDSFNLRFNIFQRKTFSGQEDRRAI